MEPRQRYRKPAAGEPHALGHFGDDADLRVGLVVLGDEKDAVVDADVHGQCHRHPREHHRVLEGNDSQPVHSGNMIALVVHYVNDCVHQLYSCHAINRADDACRAWQLLVRFFFAQREHLPTSRRRIRSLAHPVPRAAPDRARPAAAYGTARRHARLTRPMSRDWSTGWNPGVWFDAGFAAGPPCQSPRPHAERRAAAGAGVRRMTDGRARCPG